MGLKFYSKFRNRIRSLVIRATSEKISWTIRQIVWRVFFLIMFFLLLPITLIFHQIGYRRLNVNTSRIGHLAAEVDCFLKLRYLGKIDLSKKYFISANPKKIANAKLLELWGSEIRVITNSLIDFFLNFMTYGPFMKCDVSDYVLSTAKAAKYYQVNAEWRGGSTLKLGSELISKGADTLEKMGIPRGSWYVCIHARERGYSVNDDDLHDYRNFDFESLNLAIKEIISRGGYCIRLGHKTARTGLDQIEGFFDYANSEYVSDEMDLFLCGSCRFFLGNTSGLFILPSIFTVPVILTNVIPITSMPFQAHDLSIFKKILNLNTGKLMTIKEMLDSEIVHFRVGALYKKQNLSYIDNSPEEIRNVTLEMLELIDRKKLNEESELMKKFRRLVQPHHYCFEFASRVSAKYLYENRELLD